MDAKKLLQDITEERCLCLEELAIRKEFVHWVKEALEGRTDISLVFPKESFNYTLCWIELLHPPLLFIKLESAGRHVDRGNIKFDESFI